MSINPFKKLEEQIKRALNHLGDDIKRGINSLGDQIKKQLSQAGDNIRRGLESTGKQLKGEIEGVAHKAKGELEHVGEEAKGELQHLANEAKGEIEDVAKKAKGELEEVAEDAKDLVEAALQELGQGGDQGGAQETPGRREDGRREDAGPGPGQAPARRVHRRLRLRTEPGSPDAGIRRLLQPVGGTARGAGPVRRAAAGLSAQTRPGAGRGAGSDDARFRRLHRVRPGGGIAGTGRGRQAQVRSARPGHGDRRSRVKGGSAFPSRPSHDHRHDQGGLRDRPDPQPGTWKRRKQMQKSVSGKSQTAPRRSTCWTCRRDRRSRRFALP